MLISATFNIIKWVDDSANLQTDETKKLRNEFTEKFRACFVQVKVDSDQFGSLQHNLKQDYGPGQDHCKVKIDDVMEV